MIWLLAAQEGDDPVRNIVHGLQQSLGDGIMIVGPGQLQRSHAIAIQRVHIGARDTYIFMDTFGALKHSRAAYIIF